MELSYAQNMEDIHLAQVFGARRDGFYIDVGGGHPVADNVSFKAYLAGWRGVVVEPQEHLHRLYATVRPRDLAVNLLVGASEGEAAFHQVDRLHGFSTTVSAHAEGASAFGAAFTTVSKPMTTLAALCAAHAPPVIDWLKIDVEGAELDVLKGADFGRFRPRVILIEAILPGSMAPSHEAWEPLLLAADYAHVFFDGLNRWYLAKEAEGLAARMPASFQDWGSVRHLYDHGRALERRDHPDHALASALMGLKPASLPLVEAETVFGFLTKNLTADELAGPPTADALDRFSWLWLGTEPHGYLPHPTAATLEGELRAMIASDPFRAALGRIAAAYDGGFLMEE